MTARSAMMGHVGRKWHDMLSQHCDETEISMSFQTRMIGSAPDAIAVVGRMGSEGT